ncbi:SRPBCC family protein [Nonlabens sp.]|uniref:SRPBCC family protein n=1 Tax=Nonlabens sp. TaxID=1888209 RepID=UPI003F69D00C
MKAVKYIFILILILFIGGAVYFSIKDGKYDITKSESIDAPPSLIFDQIKDFKQWSNWYPLLKDKEVSAIMGKQTQGIDANYSFTSPNGTGTMTITSIEPDKSITFNMIYENGMTSSNSEVVMNLEPIENGTQLTWNIKGEQGLLDKVISEIFGFYIETEITPDYEKGLKNIEAVITKNMDIYTTNIDGIIETGGGYFLYMSTSSNKENLPDLMAQMLQNIMSYMQRNQIDLYGMPRIIYEKNDPLSKDVIFSAAIPVQNREITETDSKVLCSYQEPSKAVKVTLKGAYKNLPEAWRKGEEFIDQNGLLKSDAAPYEIYKIDPKLVVNPAEYLTEIYISIQ